MPAVAPSPLGRPKEPDTMAPPGACDGHAHMVGREFPLSDGRIEDPGAGALADWLDLYRTHLETLGFSRGVIVQSILYGTDNSVTAAAIEALGRDRFRGVGLVTDAVDDRALGRLADQGFGAIRLNYVHGGVLSFDGVVRMAPRLKAHGLHVQMLMHADQHMAELAERVRGLPLDVVFDHAGWPDLGAGPAEPGFAQLCRLLADGQCWVKLSGVYRLCEAPYEAADAMIAALVAANPERCLWGSDWPHLMLGDAALPDAGVLLDAFHRAVPGTDDRRRVLVDNPTRLYGFAD